MDPQLAQRLRHFQGVAALKELCGSGVPRAAVHRAVEDGELERPRHGLYALPGADPRFVQARSSRSLLTCVSAAGLYGLWVLVSPGPEARPHLVRSTGADSPDAVVHRERRVPPHPRAPVAGLADVVLHALRCLPELEALVIAECAVTQKGRKTHEERVQRGKDRVRDREAQLRGLVTLRYGYADVVHRSWVLVEEVSRILGGRPLVPCAEPTGFGPLDARSTGAPGPARRQGTRKPVGFGG